MTILLRDGRTLIGTPLQIVRQMQEVSFGGERVPLADYVEGCIERARQEGIVLKLFPDGQVAPDTKRAEDEALARALINAMLEGGLAKLLRS